jgi:hypothetical protein
MLGEVSDEVVQLAQVAMLEEVAMLKRDLSLTLYRVKFLIGWMLWRKKEGGKEGRRAFIQFLIVEVS